MRKIIFSALLLLNFCVSFSLEIDRSLKGSYDTMKNSYSGSGYKNTYNTESNEVYKSNMEEKTKAISNNTMFSNYENMANSNNSKYNSFYNSTLKKDNSNVKLYEENSESLRKSYNERFGSMDFSSESILSKNSSSGNSGSTGRENSGSTNKKTRGISEDSYLTEETGNTEIIGKTNETKYVEITGVKTKANIRENAIYDNNQYVTGRTTTSKEEVGRSNFSRVKGQNDYEVILYNREIKKQEDVLESTFFKNITSSVFQMTTGINTSALKNNLLEQRELKKDIAYYKEKKDEKKQKEQERELSKLQTEYKNKDAVNTIIGSLGSAFGF
jgi:hypothetical protein